MKWQPEGLPGQLLGHLCMQLLDVQRVEWFAQIEYGLDKNNKRDLLIFG